ncbi:MAG: histidine kinase [Thiobacillaceae bacterium]|nr:histidine kinase [Thiobacillaceae bacterium]
MPKQDAVRLPDFRNLGVLLRAALLVQLFALVSAVIAQPGLGGVGVAYMDMAALLQPPLFIALLSAYFASPWLSRQDYRRAAAILVGFCTLVGLAWYLWLRHLYPDAIAGSAPRAALLAALTALAVLAYFDWRHRVLSPALAEARLQALQARIRPHFFYNSLNTVLALLRREPRAAEEALLNLAELFRVHMADNRQLSPLARELELARAYTALERHRLGERLRLVWKVDNAPAQALLPPLVLQPLVENAIHHGVEPSPQGGEVRVDVFTRGDTLNLVVRNPVHAEGERRDGIRMALANIRERLMLHFDADARLTAQRVGGEFIVQIVMPLRLGTAD